MMYSKEERDEEFTAADDKLPKVDQTGEDPPVLSAFTPKVDGWDVRVIESDGACKTVFSVGAQHFTIAEGDSSEEGVDHCCWMRLMFLQALAARDALLQSERTPKEQQLSLPFLIQDGPPMRRAPGHDYQPGVGWVDGQVGPSTVRPPITHVALRFDDKVWSLPRPYRHHHIIRLIGWLNPDVDRIGDHEQGFLDASGRFLTRKQALNNAVENSQVKNGKLIGSILTSEDLW